MSKSEPWHSLDPIEPCACTQLRRTARKVSAFYDAALQESGLTVTQHALLVNVARAGQISRTALACKLGMDRTTLTRNLKPLEQTRLISSAASTDRRERLLQISAEGKRTLQKSYPQWASAQRIFRDNLGPQALEQLRQILQKAETAAV
jgi:DNA-binding MarR family transcriptional regulator